MCKMLSPKTIKTLLRYDSDNGLLFWRERPANLFTSGFRSADGNCAIWNSRYSGKMAFISIDKGGYRRGRVFSKKYLAHRVIWAMQTGSWPEHEIDHIDHYRSNNRWNNLRAVTSAENKRNATIRKDNTSGCAGVSFCTRINKWVSAIKTCGKREYLGSFAIKSDAVAARKAAEIEHGFHPNHGRK